jgi:ankyrin repeat protein
MKFCLDIVQSAAGREINFKGRHGPALLDSACESSSEVVEWLLDQGVDPLSDAGFSLPIAASNGQLESCRLILDRIRPTDGGEWPAEAAQALEAGLRYDDVLDLFLDYGVNPVSPIVIGQTALASAIYDGNKPAIEKMLRAHPEIWHSEHLQEVVQSVMEDWPPEPTAIHALIDLYVTGNTNMDLSVRGAFGYTMLHLLVENSPETWHSGAADNLKPGWIPCLQRLIEEAGLDLAAGEAAGETALHFAIDMRKTEFALLIIQACTVRAPHAINARPDSGRTPLHWACEKGGELNTVVSALIDAGADLNAADAVRGATPLHNAVILGDPETVDLLLDAGADIDRPDHLGRTPLNIAAISAPELIRPLVGRGADFRFLDTRSILEYLCRLPMD